MPFTPRTFFSGVTDFINRHNLNYSDIAGIINVLEEDVNALKAAGAPGTDLDIRQIAFNQVVNGAFEFFTRDDDQRPDVWRIENEVDPFVVEKISSDLVVGNFSVKTTGKGQLTQKLHESIVKSFNQSFQSFSITFACYIKTSVENTARVGMSDGVTTLFDVFKSGNGEFEQGVVTITRGSNFPTDIKFVLDSQGGEVIWNGCVAIRGNPTSGPIFIANDPTIEALRNKAYIEKGSLSIRGTGYKTQDFGDRQLSQRVTFCSPKIETPVVILKSEEPTGFEIDFENIDECGFDIVVTEVGGDSIFYGFLLNDIEWLAEVIGF